jgi:predicted kinase
VLIAFGGLPGTGKTTLARTVTSRYAAVYLRIDTVEQAIQDSDVLRANIGAAGYAPPKGWLQATYALAARLLETRLIRLRLLAIHGPSCTARQCEPS